MKFDHSNTYGNKQTWEEIIYGKSREPLGSRVLKHLGIICAGVYLGSLISDNLELGLISLGLAWGSVGVRHLLYRRRDSYSCRASMT